MSITLTETPLSDMQKQVADAREKARKPMNSPVETQIAPAVLATSAAQPRSPKPAKQSKKKGRKPLPAGETRESITLRFSVGERQLISDASKQSTATVSAWMRSVILNAAREATDPNTIESRRIAELLCSLMFSRHRRELQPHGETYHKPANSLPTDEEFLNTPVTEDSLTAQPSRSKMLSAPSQIDTVSRKKRKYTRKPKEAENVTPADNGSVASEKQVESVAIEIPQSTIDAAAQSVVADLFGTIGPAATGNNQSPVDSPAVL